MSLAQDIEIEPQNDFFNKESYVNKWKTKNGRVLNIPDMEDSHLINTIKMMIRKKERPYYLLEEYFKRKEIL